MNGFGSAEHLEVAMGRLDRMAQQGCVPLDLAAEAERIAAGWWWDAQGDLAPERLVLMVQELRHWCSASARAYGRRWDRLHRAGCPAEAEAAGRWATALDEAQRALHLYD